MKGFNAHFISLSEDDIQTLYVPPHGANAEAPLPVADKRRLCILLASYHHFSRELKRPIAIERLKKTQFDLYRTQLYVPHDKITPWRVAAPRSSNPELTAWKKSVKLSKSDFTPFKDEVYWVRWKKSFLSTLESQDLQHVVDSSIVPTDMELDALQRKWVYKVLVDVAKTPITKTIVDNHYDDKDTRAIWDEIQKHYDGSMTTQLHSQRLSTYLTSARLDRINWKGTQQTAILNYKQQANIVLI